MNADCRDERKERKAKPNVTVAMTLMTLRGKRLELWR